VIEFESAWEQTGDPSTYAWENHEYVEKGGEQYLDQCNGRTQPDGSYGYHATATFPYILGCYVGSAEGAGEDGPPNGGADEGDDGPTECEDESECPIEECPDGSMGCTCAEAPTGVSYCVPTCTSTADCPDVPDLNLACDEGRGICVPGGGPG
jgi:hypothetical protein